VYLHVFEWPTDGFLNIPGVMSSARVLVGGVPLPIRGEGDRTVIDASSVAPDPLGTVVVLE
jgi:alpha-L-fucosidase